MKNKRANENLLKEIKKIKEILDAEKATLNMIKVCKERALDLITQGYVVPGYEAVKSYGNRKWQVSVDKNTLHDVFKKYIPLKKVYEEVRLISPAKLEKYLQGAPEDVKNKMKDFIEIEDKGYALKAKVNEE